MKTNVQLPPQNPAHNADKDKTTILLVDDSEILRHVYAKVLLKTGYGVVEACGAEDALVHLLDGLAVGLLLTDYRMPGMNGRIFAEWFQGYSPHVPVVLMSLEPESIGPPKEDLSWLHIHQKPSSEEELLKLVRGALGDGQSGGR